MEDSEFSFRDEDHTYWLGDQQLPSVTTIISASGHGHDYSKVPEELTPEKWEWILNRAGEIGSIVHETVADFHMHGEELYTDDWSAMSYIEGYKSFLDFHDIDPIVCEVPMYCPCYLFAGTVDMVAWFRGELVVFDIKTSNNLDEDSVSLQTAAYEHMFEDWTDRQIDNRMVIHLTKEGMGFRLVECNDEGAFETFLESLEGYND